MDDPRRVRLLMTIAAYGDFELQREILTAIGGVRHPLALQALQTLWRLLDADLQPLVRRQIQKLRLSGVKDQAPGRLRALWSPGNAQGHSFLWFIRTSDEAPLGDLLTLILHDQLGIVYATAYPALDLDALPMPAPRGATLNVRMIDSAHHLLLAEIDPLLGLGLLDEALTSMARQSFPWPGEIVVFGHWLWAGRNSPSSQFEWPRMPAPAPGLDEAAVQSLLKQPVFAGWVWSLPDLGALLRGHRDSALEKNGKLHQAVIDILLDDENRPLLSQRLLQLARWLVLTRDTKTARQVLAVREAVDAGDSRHPFIRMLAWRSLLTAAADRAMRNALKMLDNEQKMKNKD
jgi:hypothetical protein